MKDQGGSSKSAPVLFPLSFILYPSSFIGLLVLAALLVAWRRWAGALSHPLAPAVMMLVAASLAAAAVLARSGRPAAFWSLLLSAAILLLGSSLCIAGSGRLGLLAFWAIVAGEEGWAWGRPLVARRRRGPQPAKDQTHRFRIDPAQSLLPRPAPPEVLGGRDETLAEDVVPAENVLQRLTLSQQADGSQRLSGWLRLRLTAGQRSGVVHVAFCPPFCQTPELSLEQLEGPPARVRTAQLLPHGVRLDLKLSTAAAAEGSVLLRFAAWTAGGQAIPSPAGRGLG